MEVTHPTGAKQANRGSPNVHTPKGLDEWSRDDQPKDTDGDVVVAVKPAA
jgi:hypothetical protein